MALNTARLNLPYPESADAADVPADIQALAEILDVNVLVYIQGNASARPAAPSIATVYFAVDTGSTTYFDGANWRNITVPVPEDGPANVATMRTLGTSSRSAAAGNDTRFLNIPTPSQSTRSTRIATTAFVHTLRDALVGGAPAVLDTLDEIADALADDANLAATLTQEIAMKLGLNDPITRLNKVTEITQANYDALAAPDADTFYLITE